MEIRVKKEVDDKPSEILIKACRKKELVITVKDGDVDMNIGRVIIKTRVFKVKEKALRIKKV